MHHHCKHHAERKSTDPTDKSMPPEIMTSVIPSAIIAMKVTLRVMLYKFLRQLQKRRQRLARQDQRDRWCRMFSVTRHASTTSLASPGRIVIRPGMARSDKMLDRLMRGTVFADADRVVREDVDDRDLHDRGEADRGAAVIAEDQKARPIRPHLESDRPFSTAPMACSRMPKWKLRPP